MGRTNRRIVTQLLQKHRHPTKDPLEAWFDRNVNTPQALAIKVNFIVFENIFDYNRGVGLVLNMY